MLPIVALSLAAMISCSPIADEASLWAAPKTSYIVVGEIHGTAEIPAFFGDLACAAHASGRPVVVALEAAETEQGAIGTFVASDGGDEARKAFLHSSIWNLQMKDGRSSRAYLDLFERLRTLKKAGQIADVVAIQPVRGFEQTPSETEYNAAMAGRFRAARARYPNALVLILVGNVHASKSSMKFGTKSVLPAAADLPRDETISLNVVTGGEAWTCHGPSECGPHNWTGGKPERRAVRLGQGAPNYDGVIDLGVPTTASPPAVP